METEGPADGWWWQQYNRYNSQLLQGSSHYPLYGAQLFNFMYGVRDAHLCLRRGKGREHGYTGLEEREGERIELGLCGYGRMFFDYACFRALRPSVGAKRLG